MILQSYTTSFSVGQTPKQAFNTIRNVRSWWSGEIEGDTSERGDEFTYRYKEIHYSKQGLIEVVPGRKVVWFVLDSCLSFPEDKTAPGSCSKSRKATARPKSASRIRVWFPTISASTSARAPGASTSTTASES